MMNPAQMQAEIKKLKAENELLRKGLKILFLTHPVAGLEFEKLEQEYEKSNLDNG